MYNLQPQFRYTITTDGSLVPYGRISPVYAKLVILLDDIPNTLDISEVNCVLIGIAVSLVNDSLATYKYKQININKKQMINILWNIM